MKKLLLRILLAISLMELASCSSVATKTSAPIAPKVLVVSGYSQLVNHPQVSSIQNRYAAEQVAKLNAYRELAKQLYSEKLIGELSVAEQVIKNEAYRIYTDLFIRGARVKESFVLSDQLKVVLELALIPRFYDCISTSVDVVNQCLQEDKKSSFTRVGYQQVPISTVNLDCFSFDCSTQLSMSGFSKKKNPVDSAMLNYGLYDSEWTINMALKSVFRYFVITKAHF